MASPVRRDEPAPGRRTLARRWGTAQRRDRAMIRFYVARQRFDAFLVADRLNQAGIKAHVFNQHAASIVGDIPPDSGQPQVWLEREQDRERATILLARLDEEARAGGSVRCTGCGEESPANFDLCWKCGASLARA